MRMTDVKPVLMNLFDEGKEFSLCSHCNIKPSVITHQQLAIIQCTGCGSCARGFLSASCVKCDSDIKQSVVRLRRSWNDKQNV